MHAATVVRIASLLSIGGYGQYEQHFCPSHAGGIKKVSITNAGSGYLPDTHGRADVTGGTGSGARVHYTTDPNGAISSATVNFTAKGKDYVVGDSVGVGTGTGQLHVDEIGSFPQCNFSVYNATLDSWIRSLDMGAVCTLNPVALANAELSSVPAINVTTDSTSGTVNSVGHVVWDVSTCTSLENAFKDSTNFTGVESWDVHKIENFMSTFENAVNFDEDISGWKMHEAAMGYESEPFLNMFKGATTLSLKYENYVSRNYSSGENQWLAPPCWVYNNGTQWVVNASEVGQSCPNHATGSARFTVVANGPNYFDGGDWTPLGYDISAKENIIATDESMLENLMRSNLPISFVHRYELINLTSGAIPVPLPPTAYRMTAPSDPRCLQKEHCFNSMCVMLDMNYFGYSVAHNEFFTGTNPNRTYVPGMTYCGPIFGTDSPIAGDTTENDKPLAQFPQARPVSVEYEPMTGAGAVLPLATETRMPSWYYVDGYFGWRQNGARRPSAPGCFSRHVPRWMVPPTCKRDAGEGCVNGHEDGNRISTDANTRDLLQTYTLADAENIGLQGLWVSGGCNSTPDATVTSYYDDKSRIKKPEVFVSERAGKSSSFSPGAAATHLWTNLYYTIPATGLNGFNPWCATWQNATTDTARLPFPSSNERSGLSGPTPQSVMKTLVYKRDNFKTPQQTEVLTDAPMFSADDSYGGMLYENKRLYKFTPEGMYSPEMFQATGLRQFFHPLFEYFRPNQTENTLNNPNLENVSFSTSSAPSETYFGCDNTTYATDYHTPSGNCMTEANQKPGSAFSAINPVPFGASFINIEQAMKKWVDQYTSHPSPPSPPTHTLPAPLPGTFNCGFAQEEEKSGGCCVCAILGEAEIQNTLDYPCSLSDFTTAYDQQQLLKNPAGTIWKNLPPNERVQKLRPAILNLMGHNSNPAPYFHRAKRGTAKFNKFWLSQSSTYCTDSWAKTCGTQCLGPHRTKTYKMVTNLWKDKFYEVKNAYQAEITSVEKAGNWFLPPDVCYIACNWADPNSERKKCAEQCYMYWYRYLITPYDVVANFAKTWPHRKVGSNTGGIQFGFANPENYMEAIFSVNKGLLDKTGRFMTSEERTTPRSVDTTADTDVKMHKHVRTALLSLYTPKNTKQATKDLLETTVDESMCDLSVCDIADSESWMIPLNERKDFEFLFVGFGVLFNPKQSVSPFRCVPKNFAQAHLFKYTAAQLDGSGQTMYPNEDTPDWYSREFLTSLYSGTVANISGWSTTFTQKLGVFAVPTQVSNSYKKQMADYSKVTPIVKQHTTGVHYRPVLRDAGFSGRYHDANANPCDCSRNRIVLREGDVPPGLTTEMYPEVDANPDVFQVVQFGFSWYAPPDENAPMYGLYLGSTSQDVELVERDFLDVPDPDTGQRPLSDTATWARWLQPQAPTLPYAPYTQYKHVAGDLTTCSDPNDSECTGLANHTFASEWAVTIPYSCARYPFGRLHRNAMHPDVRTALYGDQPVGTHKSFLKEPTNGHSSVNQGYCEKLLFQDNQDRGYRFCPNDIMSAEARRKFCATNLLATHFLTGVMIKNRPFSSRCSVDHQMCLLVPGYTAPGSNSNSPGSIGAHTSPSGDVTGYDLTNYTLLVTPWNFTYSQFILRDVHKSLQATPDPESPFLIKLPSKHTKDDLEPLNYTSSIDRNAFAFHDTTDLFHLLSNLDGFIDTKCRTELDKVECVVDHVDTYIDTMLLSNPCGDSLYKLPALTNGNAESTVCAPISELFPPNPEIGAMVVQDGMTVRSASRNHPLQFKGPIGQAVSTCTRFEVVASRFSATFNADQRECQPSVLDSALLAPVVFKGDDVTGATINVTAQTTSAPVLMLGETLEGTSVHEMKATGSRLTVNGDFAYDFGISRAGGNISLECSDGDCVAVLLPSDAVELEVKSAITGVRCEDGTFSPELHPVGTECMTINVSAYVGLFGSAFEQRMFAVSNAGAYESYIVLSVGCALILVILLVALKRRHDRL